MTAYYNEFDPFAASWLRELIKDGLIAPGEVDERSIKDVAGSDLRGFTQVHFFAGIGGWSYALRLAGWPDDRPVWTGSCPCQPFSAAGKRQGTSDDRHLWPEMRRLVSECSPATVFGEQVAAKDGRLWLAGVRADLEALGYAVGAADLCAAGVGAPHIRQRLWWVGHSDSAGRQARDSFAGGIGARPEQLAHPGTHVRLADANGGLAGHRGLPPRRQHGQQPQDAGARDGLADSSSAGLERRPLEPAREECAPAERSGDAGGLADTGDAIGRPLSIDRQDGCDRPHARWEEAHGEPRARGEVHTWGPTFLGCADGKARRVEPSIQPLAHGVPNRVGTLRGAGNAIVPQVAAEFIGAYLES